MAKFLGEVEELTKSDAVFICRSTTSVSFGPINDPSCSTAD